MFADPDKTEKATPRRRQKAREEGQTGYSKDLSMAIVFLSLVVLLRFLMPFLYEGMGEMISYYISIPFGGEFEEVSFLSQSLQEQSSDLWWVLLAVLFGGLGIALVVGFMQTKLLFSLKALKFDINRINPLSGFKRLFSIRSVIELLKNLGKLAMLALIGWTFIMGIWDTLYSLPWVSLPDSMAFLGDSLFRISLLIGFALLALGFFDFFYQRWEFERNIRMSKKEIKDEYKNIEGNPQVKQKQRQLMAEMAKRRMMEEVPSATVVVTNPTHYAVALRFDVDQMDTPILVAKGVDEVAHRIIEVAKEYGVAVHRDPPLARQLYAEVEIGEEIPPHMFHAVAQVLAYVLKMAGKV